jgi:hypothetical protein
MVDADMRIGYQFSGLARIQQTPAVLIVRPVAVAGLVRGVDRDCF